MLYGANHPAAGPRKSIFGKKYLMPKSKVDKEFARCVFGALISKHGDFDAIPAVELEAARKVCGMDPEQEREFAAAARSRSPLKSPTSPVPSPPRPNSGSHKPKAKSVVRAYILDRPVSARHATAVQQDTYNLRRVLNEIQLRMPALRKLQQQHEIDLDTEAGQAKSFVDVFTLLDEDGSGDVSLEEFLAFGRRVGGECANVFTQKLFNRIDVKGRGEMNKGEFIAVLFPRFAAQRRRREQVEHANKKKEVTTWEDSWHPKHLDTLRTIFHLCDTDRDGLVSLPDILRVYNVHPDQRPWFGGLNTPEEDFTGTGTPVDGRMNLETFAAMMKPTFSTAPSDEAEEITEFYFQGIEGQW